MDPAVSTCLDRALEPLADRVRMGGVVVLTGAGCSTGSGIPDYRDAEGEWKRAPPMQAQALRASEAARRRYWARSAVGWPRFAGARPNDAHRSLAKFEHVGCVRHVLTQNVDGLHQAAGSRAVIDLHGSLARVRCHTCGACESRSAFQQRLLAQNPALASHAGTMAPDGDADIGSFDTASMRIPPCTRCGGWVRPDVVLFGETLPPARSSATLAALDEARTLLVIGSSLVVHTGFRLARRAVEERRIPVWAINLGRTRADTLLTARIPADCTLALPRLAALLGLRDQPSGPLA